MSFSGENSALFDDDDYLGYDARLQSQRFDPLTKFGELDSVADDGVFVEESVMDTTVRVYCSGDVIGLNSTPKLNEEEDMAVGIGGSDFPALEEVVDEKGFALREWRRLNVIRLAEKDKLEKEVRTETILEAEEFKVDFYKRRQVTVENKKVSNREKQKIFLENHEKFHKEAVTNYWKAISELVTNEVPAIERRGEKDKDKKPSITVIQGPKPGKPTDLSRMRQILSKLRHHTPLHLVPTPSSSSPDAKTDSLALHAALSQPVAAA